MKQSRKFRVTYRIDQGIPGRFHDVTFANVDHMPSLTTIVQLPDGSGRYGRVIAIERQAPAATAHTAKGTR